MYICAKISIKPNWIDLAKFANASKNIDLEQKIIENDVNEKNSKKYQKKTTQIH